MTKHEYKWIEATWAGSVTSVNGARPIPDKTVWELVNSLGAAGWRVVHITPIGLGDPGAVAGGDLLLHGQRVGVDLATEKAYTVWVVLHRESPGPEPL